MFGERDSWFNHELKHHYAIYGCSLCGRQGFGLTELEKHIIACHGTYSGEQLAALTEQGKMVPHKLKAQDCPFCDDWAATLSHRKIQAESGDASGCQPGNILVSLTSFKRHVATHQEKMAAFVVPKAIEDDEKSKSGEQDLRDGTQKVTAEHASCSATHDASGSQEFPVSESAEKNFARTPAKKRSGKHSWSLRLSQRSIFLQ